MLVVALRKRLLLQQRTHRYWVHDIFKRRKQFGAYYHLVQELALDADRFHEHFRMSPQQLDKILGYVGPLIQKKDIGREDAIEPKQRLVICIRQVLFYSFIYLFVY